MITEQKIRKDVKERSLRLIWTLHCISNCIARPKTSMIMPIQKSKPLCLNPGPPTN